MTQAVVAPARFVVLLLGLLFVAPVAWGQSTDNIDLAEESDLQFELGVDAYRKGDYRGALEHLLASNRLVPNKNVVFNIARAYEKIGRYAEAYRHYSDYLELELDPVRRKPAEEAVERIRGEVALLRIETTPPDATLYIDRRDLGARGASPRTLALPPGEHAVFADLDGYESGESQAVALKIGETSTVTLVLKPILGTVQVDGTPVGAEIRVDDEQGPVVGRVPAAVQLRPGPHVLIIGAPGHQTSREVVTVAQNETTRTAASLALVTGVVVVNAIERDALIEIDGQAVGFTPAVLPSVPAGEHTIRVTLRGYRPFEQQITVAQDEQLTLNVELRSLQEVTAASRQAEDVEDAPASVSLISGEEIRAFGYETLYDALGGTRGFYQTNDLTYEFLGVRGFSRVGDYGNRLLVTLDGHTLNDDQLGASYVGTDLMADLEDVERIEVVRGPGSALYGTNAFFGVVNVVTRDADTLRPPHVGIATSGLRGARVRAGGGKAFEDGGGLWLSAGGTASQGADYYFPEYDDPDLGSDGWSRGADGSRSGTLALKAWKGDLTFQAFYNSRTKRIPTGAYETSLAHPRAHSDDSRGFAELRYEPELGDNVQLYSRAYIDRYEFDGDYPYDEPPNYFAADHWTGTWVGVEPRLVASPTEALRLTAGLEARTSIQAHIHGQDWYYDEEDYVYLDESPVLQVYSGYLVGDLDLGEVATASLGARYDQFSTFGGSFNPRAAVIVRPTARDTIKLLAGRAFRAPSPYELFYNDDGWSQEAPESLEPETILTAEGELTHRFSDVVSATASVYYNDIDNLIDIAVNDDGLLQYYNTDVPVRTLGEELEIRRDWRRGWMVAMAYGFQRTRLEDPFAKLPKRLTNSPDYLASIKAAAPIGSNATLASRLRGESPRLTEARTWTTPALLWDLTATGDVPSAQLSWSLGVRNVLDWEVEHPGGADLAQVGVPQPGRTFFAEAILGF